MTPRFVGEPLTPLEVTFASSSMAAGKPGLPERFTWKGGTFGVAEVLEEWKEAGDCRHGDVLESQFVVGESQGFHNFLPPRSKVKDVGCIAARRMPLGRRAESEALVKTYGFLQHGRGF